MKVSELRVGNFIQVPFGNEEPWVREVYSISGDFVVTENGRYCDDDEFDFVPLTKEWLLKFGFDGVDFEKTLINQIKISFEFRHDGLSYQLGFRTDWLPCIEIKYIHQLQNLYFSLTGQELTFKLKDK